MLPVRMSSALSLPMGWKFPEEKPSCCSVTLVASLFPFRLGAQLPQVLTIGAGPVRVGVIPQLLVADQPHTPRDLLWAADFQALPLLDRADKVAGAVEIVDRAGVQPGGTAGQHFHVQSPLFQVGLVDAGDLQLATIGGLKLLGD